MLFLSSCHLKTPYAVIVTLTKVENVVIVLKYIIIIVIFYEKYIGVSVIREVITMKITVKNREKKI